MSNPIEIKDKSGNVIAEIAAEEPYLLINNADLLPNDVIFVLEQIAAINDDLPGHQRSNYVGQLIFRDCKKSIGQLPSPAPVGSVKNCGLNSIAFQGTEETLGLLDIISSIIRIEALQQGNTGGMGYAINLESLGNIGLNCGVIREEHWDSISVFDHKLYSMDLTNSDLDHDDAGHLTMALRKAPTIRLTVGEGHQLTDEDQQALINILFQNSEKNADGLKEDSTNLQKAYVTRVVTDLVGTMNVPIPQKDGSDFVVDLMSPVIDLSGYEFHDDDEKFAGVTNILRKSSPKTLILDGKSEPSRVVGVISNSFFGSNLEEIRFSNIGSRLGVGANNHLSFFTSRGYQNLKSIDLRKVDLSGGSIAEGKYENGPSLGWFVNASAELGHAVSQIEELTLIDCGICDADIANPDTGSAALTHVVCPDSLKKVDLSGNKGITEESIFSLMEWAANSNIVELNLEETGISAERAADLNEILTSRQGIADPYRLLNRARNFIEMAGHGDASAGHTP